MKSVTLKIEGMHCDGCAQTIHAVVETLPGVQGVDASFGEGRARILYDPESIDADRLADAIRRIGFNVAGQIPSNPVASKGNKP